MPQYTLRTDRQTDRQMGPHDDKPVPKPALRYIDCIATRLIIRSLIVHAIGLDVLCVRTAHIGYVTLLADEKR